LNFRSSVIRLLAAIGVLIPGIFGSAAAGSHTFSGLVVDAETRRPLEGVIVSVSDTGPATISDSTGTFLFTADSTPPVFLFALKGYQTGSQHLSGTEAPVTVALIPLQYEMHEVVVTATRLSTNRVDSPTPVTVLTKEAIDLKTGSSVADALEGTPGVCFRAYGGGGALHTASIRGMSPEHSLLLVDGQRYTSTQNGQIDLALVSMANIERIEVVRGGSSSLYGADAIGGVINLITRRPPASLDVRLSSSFGSYGFRAYELGVSGSAGDLGWRTVVRREKGDGNYTFDFSDGRTTTRMERSGADFDLLLADLELDYPPQGSTVSSRFTLSYSRADRGTPGSVTDVATRSTARLNDNVVRSTLAAEWELSSTLHALLHTSFLYADQAYVDPLLIVDNVPLTSFSANRSVMLSPEIQGEFSREIRGVAGVEIGRSWIRSSEVRNAFRWQRSAFLSTEHRFTLPFSAPFEISFYPSLRYDSFSDVDGDISPKLGMNLGLLRQPLLHVRTSFGKSYRIPTFNDLYWRQGGNPLLKPERSVSVDAGVTARFPLLGFVNIDAGYFSIATRDRIIWIPGSASMWSPRNIARAESDGVEAQVNWIDPLGMVSVTMNSTWTSARKASADYPGDPTNGAYLIYTPRQTVHLMAQFFSGPFSGSAEHTWVSFRYTTENNDRILPGYSVTSASARLRIPLGQWTGTVKLEASNIFDTSYQVIALYPMPGREFRMTLEAEL
jgi:vitamin B12 transporter